LSRRPYSSDAALHADVVIVGAGPAGCAAAITARQLELETVVIDRDPSPRERPGESLHPGVEPVLGQLGVWASVEAAAFLRHTGQYVAWGTPRRFVPFGRDDAGPWRGLQAMRAELDTILLERARELGATVLRPCRALSAIVEDGTLVGVRTSIGILQSRITIDASGMGSWLVRELALPLVCRSRMLIARYGYASGRCRALDRAPTIVADRDGWTWMARVRPGVYAWTRLDVRPRRRHPRWSPEALHTLVPLGQPRGADVTWRATERSAGPGYLMAGDAAAVLDPASSHGVLKALMSGIAAAHAARRVVDEDRLGGDASDCYARWLESWFERDVVRLREHYRIFAAPLTWDSRGHLRTVPRDGDRLRLSVRPDVLSIPVGI